MRKATHLALTLLLVAGLGVPAPAANAQSAAPGKSAVSNSAKNHTPEEGIREIETLGKGAEGSCSLPNR